MSGTHAGNSGGKADVLVWLLANAAEVPQKGAAGGSPGPLRSRCESLSCRERKKKPRTKPKLNRDASLKDASVLAKAVPLWQGHRPWLNKHTPWGFDTLDEDSRLDACDFLSSQNPSESQN